MKTDQWKIAAGLAVTFMIGFTNDVIAGEMAPPVTKPGHSLAPTSGKSLTVPQIAAKCRAAYAALKSYQVISTVTTRSVTVASWDVGNYHTSANIQFALPGKIHVEGTDMNGSPFAYISDGIGTVQKDLATQGGWTKSANAEMAIASVTGIAQDAATTVPALLLGTNWGTPLALVASGKLSDAEVREDSVDGQTCYVLTAHRVMGIDTTAESLWIDEKTFLLRRSVSDSLIAAQTLQVAGKPFPMSATQIHQDEHFTNERQNEAIPNSTFTLPATQ